MENNVIKENQLEVIPNNEITALVELNKLPEIKDRRELLPTIIKKDALALIEIKKEFQNLKKRRSLYGLTWFLKKSAVFFAKLCRFVFLATSRLACFVVLSAIVILSTTILTKNIVNSLYGARATQEESTEYSIYSVKDDEQAKAQALINESEQEEAQQDNADENKSE